MNLDIGGQLNRKDQKGEWKILDQHPGADFQVNLEEGILPINDNTVDNIYSSHCIEHIEPNVLRSVFNEMNRVMKEGGKIRIVVPSFIKGVLWYFFHPKRLKERMMPRQNSNTPDTKMSRLSAWFHTETNPHNGVPGHKSAWDFELMKTYLEEAGFINVRRCTLKKCSDVFLGKDNPDYIHFSMYVEAEVGPKK